MGLFVFTIILSCSSTETIRVLPKQAGASSRACYAIERNEATERGLPVWNRLEEGVRGVAKPQVPTGLQARRAIWRGTLRDPAGGALGLVRLEWQYWFADSLTVREVCVEVLGVHPDVAIRTALRSAYVDKDQRFVLMLDLNADAAAEQRGDELTNHPWLYFTTEIHTTWREIETKERALRHWRWDDHRVEETFLFEPV